MSLRLSDLVKRDLGVDPVITGVTADSRKVRPGFLFAALPGSKVDGRSFAPKAAEMGAAAILAGRDIEGLSVPLVTANDPRRAYALAAAALYGAQPPVCVAVTGTNGKTSVAAFCRQIFTSLGRKAAAMGTLGVLTEVTLRVFPKPPRQAVLVVRDLLPEEGFAILRRVWQSPLEATGLSYLPASVPLRSLGYVGEGVALIRLEGADEPLKEKIAALRTIAPAAQQIDAPEIFSSIANGDVFLTQDCDVWRVFIPPTEAAHIVGAAAPQFWQADMAGGVLWIGLPPESDGVRLREACEEAGGHAVLLRASEETRNRVAVFARETKPRMALTKSVKAAFDPLSLFNPGRMWKGV